MKRKEQRKAVMSSLTLSLMMLFALPSAVVRGSTVAAERADGDGLGTMVKASVERRGAQSVELEASAGEGGRASPPVEREPGDLPPPAASGAEAAGAPSVPASARHASSSAPSSPSSPPSPSSSPPSGSLVSEPRAPLGAFVVLTLLGLGLLVVGLRGLMPWDRRP